MFIIYVTLFEFFVEHNLYTTFVLSFARPGSRGRKIFKKYTAARVNMKYISPKFLVTILKQLSILLTLLKLSSTIYTL